MKLTQGGHAQGHAHPYGVGGREGSRELDERRSENG
jgi:hypothetical protein